MKNQMTRNQKTRMLIESALMIAMSIVLSYLHLPALPQGGDISLCSMVPLIFIAYRYGWKWGLFNSFVYSVLNMLLHSVATPAVPSFFYYTLMILLDYLLPSMLVCVAPAISGLLEKSGKGGRIVSIGVGTAGGMFLKYISHILSGVLLWASYAPEGMNVWWYSLVYNGTYCLPELVLNTVVFCLLAKCIDFKTLKRPVAPAPEQA